MPRPDSGSARTRHSAATRFLPRPPALVLFAFLSIFLSLIRSSNAGFAVNPDADPITTPPAGPAAIGTTAVCTPGEFLVQTNYGDVDPGSSITITDLRGHWPDRTVDLGRHWRPFGICLARGDASAFVAIESNQSIIEVDLLTGEIVAAWRHGLPGPCVIDVDTHGQTAVVAGRDSGLVTRVDLTTAAVGPVRDVGAGIDRITLTAEGRTALATIRGGYRIAAIDTDSMVLPGRTSSFEIAPEPRASPRTDTPPKPAAARSADLAVMPPLAPAAATFSI